MNGQKERLMVLDMIAEGKITAEEAEQLFKAMDEVKEEPASGLTRACPASIAFISSGIFPSDPSLPPFRRYSVVHPPKGPGRRPQGSGHRPRDPE